MQGDLNASQDRLRLRAAGQTPSPVPGGRGGGSQSAGRRLTFTSAMSVHRYAPAIWDEEEEEEEDIEFDEREYMITDPDLAEDETMRGGEYGHPGSGMEVDDEDDAAMEEMQARAKAIMDAAGATAAGGGTGAGVPEALQPGAAAGRDAQQQMTRQQQAQMMAQQQQQEQQAIAQQQQQQQQQWAAQQQQQQQQQQPKELKTSSSRERLAPPDALRPGSISPNGRQLDPAEVTETVRRTITPSVARDDDRGYAPAPALQREDERAKRIREEEEEAARKRAKGGKDKSPSPSPAAQKSASGKLRKSEPAKESEEENNGGKKKRGGVFSGLFGGRKKEKEKSKEKNASVTSFDSAEIRASEESSKSSRPSASGSDGVISPTTNLAMQQQQQQQQQSVAMRAGVDPKQAPSTPERDPQVSQHASQLRQRDQQQQALYQQQYLSRSPSSPPEAQPSLGLWSASAVLGNYGTGSTGTPSGLGPPAPRPRPGSLILTSSSMDGSLPGVQQELSVIRIFAGKNLQTDATFKTALLNSSTIASDLVRQAIQRFRLPGGEDQSDYYLTVKQVEGGTSTVLQDHENPLVVFETLVNEAMEMPKVKRSSMGSISSVSSNLSMHPAIKKLPMNDFTDDSTVRFYLNKKSEEGVDSLLGHEGDDNVAEMSHGSPGGETNVAILGDTIVQSPRNQYLTVSTSGIPVTPERFSSPSIRFAVQLVIYREDLPDDMVFHPTTEAIVFKDQLRESEASAQAVVNPNMRKKVFMFPKNVTVAEVIELGLERFGILEGVVDGGDEVEDKMTKRRSSGRVRYGLWVSVNGQGACFFLFLWRRWRVLILEEERELTPSSKVVDAFPRPPVFRSPDRMSGSIKRRSVDSAQLLGNMDDVQPDDPVFLLRRAVSYRNSTSRHRISAPLDEIALQKMHRASASSGFSQASGDSATHHGHSQGSHAQAHRQPSAQEIIAAQRVATRANQMAILSAQPNPLRGTDILLPDNALLRSSRYDSTERMRYSYVEPDGETHDISDIIEAEWKDHPEAGLGKNDLLASVVGAGAGAGGSNQQGLGANLDRVLSRIRNGKVGREKEVGSVALSVSIEGVDDTDGDGDNDEEGGENVDEEGEGDSVVEDTLVVGGLGGGVGRESRRESHNSMPSVSEYSVDDSVQNVAMTGESRSRSVTPGSAGFVSRMPGATSAATAIAATAGVTVAASRTHTHSRSVSSMSSDERADRSSPILPRPSTSTPTGRAAADRRQPSLASVMSDSTSGYVTPPPHPLPPQVYESPRSFASGNTNTSEASKSGASPSGSGTSSRRRGPVIPKDDFGISHMMAIIEYKAAQAKSRENEGREKERSVDVVDERLFGTPVDLEKLHPQVRDIFEGGFKMLEEMDKVSSGFRSCFFMM